MRVASQLPLRQPKRRIDCHATSPRGLLSPLRLPLPPLGGACCTDEVPAARAGWPRLGSPSTGRAAAKVSTSPGGDQVPFGMASKRPVRARGTPPSRSLASGEQEPRSDPCWCPCLGSRHRRRSHRRGPAPRYWQPVPYIRRLRWRSNRTTPRPTNPRHGVGTKAERDRVSGSPRPVANYAAKRL